MTPRPLTALATACTAVMLIAGTQSCAKPQTSQRTVTQPPEALPNIRRLSPLDENAYHEPAISPDGKLLAYVIEPNDYHTSRQIWLRSLAGGPARQLTHVEGVAYSPMWTRDGGHILYFASTPDILRPPLYGIKPKRAGAKPVMPSDDFGNTLEMVPTTGAPATLLYKSVLWAALSPDGKWIAMGQSNMFLTKWKMLVMPFPSGPSRLLPEIAKLVPPGDMPRCFWAPDSRHFLVHSYTRGRLEDTSLDWFHVPINGGAPKAVGARDFFRPRGIPTLIAFHQDRVFFATIEQNAYAVSSVGWDATRTRLTGPIRRASCVSPVPHSSVSCSGLTPFIADSHYDFYFIPMDMAAGRVTGPVRRVNDQWHDRFKSFDSLLSNFVLYRSSYPAGSVLLDIRTGKEVLVRKDAGADSAPSLHLSPDGRLLAENRREEFTDSIWLRSTNNIDTRRLLCSGCGRALGFSPDSKHLLVEDAGALYTLNPQTAERHLWFRHPGLILTPIGAFGEKFDWIAVRLAQGAREQNYLLPWNPETTPAPSQWLPFPPDAQFTGGSDLLFRIGGDFLTTQRLNRATRRLDPPREPTLFPRVVPSWKRDSKILFGPGGALVASLGPRSAWGIQLPD